MTAYTLKTKVNGEERDITIHRTTNDYYGNPRYIIHFLSLGLKDYSNTKLTRSAGLTKYRGKNYGGGFVFQSYSIAENVKFILKTIYKTNDVEVQEA